ncbi:MarC family protein [Roseococcus thiosulfatophilus]|uniref:MarC family protein n=1 Tax=Roseococcus thiosulfatophilus TaxID=35813 RepID=UPI001A8C3041|nr:MarC family protein [Roseococcus thiosulfatophilus]
MFHPFVTDFFSDFVTLLVVLNPVAKLPIFLAQTAALDSKTRNRVAMWAIVISFGVLMFFLVAGQFLLQGLGVGLTAFRMAGSLVLLLFALSMIFDSAPPPPPGATDTTPLERAIFPIAMPALAGPGTMLTVVVLTDNDRFDWVHQLDTAIALVVALAVCFVVMRFATLLVQVLRRAGISILSRVMGLILAALAVEGMLASTRSFIHSL